MIVHEEFEDYIDFYRTKTTTGFKINKRTKRRRRKVIYKVEEGDTLSSISQYFLGNGTRAYYMRIYNHQYDKFLLINPFNNKPSYDPDYLYPGVELVILREWADDV